MSIHHCTSSVSSRRTRLRTTARLLGLLAVLASAIAVGATWLPGWVPASSVGRAPEVHAQEQESRVFAPFVLTGRRGIPNYNQATQAAIWTATAAARATATRTPTPSATPSDTPATAPTATSGSPGTPTASPTYMSTPDTPSPTPGDGPDAARLVPLGAGVDGETAVEYDSRAHAYLFSYHGESSSGNIDITYEVDLDHPDLARGRLAVREVTSGRYPLSGAGLYYRRLDGVLVEPWLQGRLGQMDSLEHELVGDEVRITVHETLEEVSHTKRYTLRMVGRSLEVHAMSLDPRRPAHGSYGGLTSGDVVGTNDVVSVRLPYMEAVPVSMLDHQWFASTLVDYPVSHASLLLPRGPEIVTNGLTNEVAALYTAETDGTVRPVDETVWVTVSPEISDVFPVPTNRPSRHRSALADRVHVMLTGRAPDVTFAAEAAFLEQLRDWRVTDLVVHKRHWQDPEAVGPMHGPADPAAGGSAGLEALAAAAGGMLAPSLAYSTTVEGCPGVPNPGYRPSDRVMDSEGLAKRLGDEAGGTRHCPGGAEVGKFLLAPDAARRVAVAEGDALAIPGAGGLGLETLTAWNPGFAWPGATGNALDRAAGSAHAATVGEAVREYMHMFRDLQDAVGPVFGEGAHGLWPAGYDSFFAGYVDGTYRSLSTGGQGSVPGDAYLVVPDYELTVLPWLALNYGMGPYERFFGPLDDGPLTDGQIDSLRATTLAYGHAGSIETSGGHGPDERLSAAEQVKEYVLMRALGSRYLDEMYAFVGYVDDGGATRDLSWALTHGMPLATPKLHLSYGLVTEHELWINHSGETWTILVDQEAYELPDSGWLAASDVGVFAYSATMGGLRVDYLAADGVQLLDGRGAAVQVGDLSTTDLKIWYADGQVLAEQPDGSLEWAP